jgi:hypothetical protein
MEENKFKCNTCNKYYKSYQSVWHHKKRYHVEIPTNDQQKHTLNQHLPTYIDSIKMKKTDNKICTFCNKLFSCYNSMNRHQQTCKFKKNQIEKEEMKTEIAELKKMVADLIKTKSNITNNKTTNNNNNNTINNNNGTINNNNYITIVPFGKENFVEVTTEKEHLFILKQDGNNVLYKCIEMKHFNDNLPQFHNYMRTNNRTNESKIYDQDVLDFKIGADNEIVDDVITNAEYDIDDMLKLHENKINHKHKENIKRIIEEPYSSHVEKNVNLMAYDYRNKVINTHKKKKKQQLE